METPTPSSVASAESRTKEPSNLCRSIRVLVFDDNGSAPVSAERRSGGGALNGKKDMPISETFAFCVKFYPRARSGGG